MGLSTTRALSTVLGTTIVMAGAAAAGLPAGGYIYATDNPIPDPIHGGGGDFLNNRPEVTKCIVIAICALVVIGFTTVCIWRFIRHYRRTQRRRSDVEITGVTRRYRRPSRRQRFGEPPPPYSAALSQQPVNMRDSEEGRTRTIDGREDRSIARDSDLLREPAPAYKL